MTGIRSLDTMSTPLGSDDPTLPRSAPSRRFRMRLLFVWGLLTGFALGLIVAKFQVHGPIDEFSSSERPAVGNWLRSINAFLPNGIQDRIEPTDLEPFTRLTGVRESEDLIRRLPEYDHAEAVALWLRVEQSLSKKFLWTRSAIINEEGITDHDGDGLPEYNDVFLPNEPMYCLSFSRVGNRTLAFLNLENEALNE